nr:GNAT family N-acetyltransferase [Pseudarthrobacter siccitolerans]
MIVRDAQDPACQGGGVTRAVVREIVEHARQLPGIDAISITSATFMERAHALYRSLGFRRAPTGTGTCRARTCCCGRSHSNWWRLSLPTRQLRCHPLVPNRARSACSTSLSPSDRNGFSNACRQCVHLCHQGIGLLI